MKSIYSIGLALLLLACMVTSLHAEDGARREFTKTIKKEFDISANGTTAIYNKYGKVDIKTWDRNRVKIDVTIIVNASTEAAAQKVFNRISVNFYNKSDYVKAETIIETTSGSWWNWSLNTGSDYKINYEVYLPATNSLDLSNKYGDAYVASLSGNVNVDVKYGNLKMQNVKNNAKVVIAYGNGWLEGAQNISTDVSYGKLNCGEVKDMEIISKYSRVQLTRAQNVSSNTKYDTYEIESARQFRNDGKYDNFKIGLVESAIINSAYTQVNINKVITALDLKLNYGGANIGIISKDFTTVNIVGSYADFKLGAAADANYQLDIMTKYAGVRSPSGLTITHDIDKNTSRELRGYIGSQNTRSAIVARLNYGGFTLKQE